MQLIPLTDHLFLLPGDNQGRFPRSHSFYVRDDICALIDTGVGIERLREFSSAHPVDIVINSHGHPDHTAGNWIFPNLPLHAPVQGRETHGCLRLLSERFAEPGPLAQQWYEAIGEITGFGDSAPTDFFSDGHVFDFGHQRLTAVHTPGHTADHYVLHDETNGIVLSFDLDLTPFGPWYGHRESDLGALRQSIAVVRSLEAHTIASSHLMPVHGEEAAAALDVFEGVLAIREERILQGLGNGATLEEIVAGSPCYGSYPYVPEILGYWEGIMVQLHLDELVAREAVLRREGRYFVVG